MMRHLFAVCVAAATALLLFAGGMVTSTGSGLAVPDWPNSYGWFMFSFPVEHWVGGIFYEHTHRLIASTVGFLILVQAAWLWRAEPRRSVRRLGFVALGAVVTQGVLGGITVLYYLPEPVSIAHAGLAQLVFCLTVTIALVTSPGWTGVGVQLSRAANPSTPSKRGPATGAGIRGPIQVNSGATASSRAGATPDDRTLQRLAVATTAAIYVQILVGATMRHTGAGLAIPDFPWAFGRLVPPHWDAGIAIHFAHRVGALVVTGFVAATAGHALYHHWRRPALARPAALLLALLAVQVTLGALTVLSGRQPIINSLHVVTGASVLATSLVLTLRAHRVRFADLPAVPGSVPGREYLQSAAAAGGTGARA